MREGSDGALGPVVLGREVAGIVVQIGPAVASFAVGDEVFGGCPGMVGGWAEYTLVQAPFAAHRPS
jgi:NADPH:quinone reductase-like Zn-dependent oxidoreductase